MLSSFLIQAQTYNTGAPVDIRWGQDLKQPNATFLTKIIGSDANGFYTLRNQVADRFAGGNHHIFLEYYNRKMDLVKAQKIDTRYKGKDREFEDVIRMGGQLWLLTSFNNEAKKKNYLFAQSVAPKSLTLRKTLTKIGEIDSKNRNKSGSFAHHISRDSSKILIYNQLPYDKGQPEKFSLTVYDNQFNNIWHKDITLPYRDDLFAVKEYKIDNKGNVHLLGKLFLEKNRGKGRANYQYIILTYKGQDDKPSQYKINLENKFITDFTFEIDDKSNLICSGFYSDLGIASIKGTYFFKVDAESKKVFSKNFKEFDFDFLIKDLSKKKQAKLKRAAEAGDTRKTAELPQYSLDHLVLRNDGGALLVAERFFAYRRNNSNYYDPYYNYSYGYSPYNRYNRDYDTYYYHYEDIIIVNIDPSGNIQWTARIPKQQVSTNDGGYLSSYAMSIVKDKLYFVYNDDIRNLSEKAQNKNKMYEYKGSRSVISLAELDTKGQLQFYPLFSSKQADIQTRPKVCKQIGKNEMVIYGERGGKYKFAKVLFK